MNCAYKYRTSVDSLTNPCLVFVFLDKDLKELRQARWDKAFKESAEEQTVEDTVNRKATIVIEQ